MNVSPQVFVSVKPADISLAPGEKGFLQLSSDNGTTIGYAFPRTPFSVVIPFAQLQPGEYYAALYKEHELYPGVGQYNAEAPVYARGEFYVGAEPD